MHAPGRAYARIWACMRGCTFDTRASGPAPAPTPLAPATAPARARACHNSSNQQMRSTGHGSTTVCE
eukprot:1833613-Alexandrium_andersonii.AAC.1